TQVQSLTRREDTRWIGGDVLARVGELWIQMLNVALAIEVIDPHLAPKAGHGEAWPDILIVPHPCRITGEMQRQTVAGLAERLSERSQQILPRTEDLIHLCDP